MKLFTILLMILLSFALFISGCGTSKLANLYTLNAMDRELQTLDVTANKQDIALKIGPITIPDALDAMPIVTRLGRNRLFSDDFNRWGGDFQSDIQQVIAENLSILLPSDSITMSQEVNIFPVDFQVIINVREFYGELGGMVTLNADWSMVYLSKDRSVVAKKSVFQEKTKGIDYPAYVAAQSRLLAKLSQEIVTEIRKKIKTQ